MYIYKITNLVNNKIYIGQTIRSIKKRFNQHCNCKNMLISKAIQKYGRENFKIEVVNEFSTIDELNFFEEYYISLFNSLVPHGYNLDTGGLNFQMHKDTKRKLSEVKIGKCLDSKRKKTISKFLGVMFKRKNTFKASLTMNKKCTNIATSKSEKWCAYMYDQYCIENNLIERRLNNISYEEAYSDYLQYYNQNGLLKTKTSKYKYVCYYNKENLYKAGITLNNKRYYIGNFKTEIEAVKAVNQYIIDNNIDRPLQEI